MYPNKPTVLSMLMSLDYATLSDIREKFCAAQLLWGVPAGLTIATCLVTQGLFFNVISFFSFHY